MRDRRSDTAHRRVLEAKLGRKLTANEVSHHEDEDKTNNAPANLTAKTRGAHTRDHNQSRGVSTLRKVLRMTKEGRKLY